MKRISLAMLVGLLVTSGTYEGQGQVDTARTAFRELRRRVQTGEATEQQRQYFGWLLPRIYPFEALPEGLYERARRQQISFIESSAADAAAASGGPKSWAFIGPTNIEGRVTALALHPTDPSVIYAAGESGGVFKTTDGGDTWSTRTDALPDLRILDLQFLPSNAANVFAGAGTGHLYVSTNAGETWTTRSLLPDARDVDRIRINPQNSDIMYAVQQDFFGGLGVYRSGNGGLSWTKSLSTSITCPPTCTFPPPAGFNDLAMDTLSPDVLYAVLNQDGIYGTGDGGASWTRLNTAGSGLPTRILDGSVGIAPTASGTVYAALQDPFGDKGFYLSVDYGQTWVRRTSPSQCCFGEIVVDPSDAALVYFSHFGSLYKSTDAGLTLTPIPQNHVDQQSFAIQPGSNHILWAGNDGGLDRSTDRGATWTTIERLPITQYYGLAVMPGDANLILGMTQDNWINRYHGTLDWDQLINACGFGDLSAAVFHPTNPSIAYAQSVLTFVNKTLNGGTTWFCASSGLDNTGSVWKAPLAMFRSNPDVLYAGGSRVHMTRDGSTWTPISAALAGTAGLSAIRSSASSSERIYAGFSDGQVFRTDNGGGSWISITGPWPSRYITALAVDPGDDAIVYLTLGGFGTSHVWRTADAGATWKDIGSALPDVPFNDVATSQETKRIVVVNDIGGVFESVNRGVKWRPAGDLRTLPNTFVTGVALEPGVELTVSTYGRSMWRLPGRR